MKGIYSLIFEFELTKNYMNFLKPLFSCIVCLAAYYAGFGQSQSWKPSVDGILSTYQYPGGSSPGGFDIQFMPNGPLGRDWIFGHWLDSDSLTRCVGYRSGGKWKSLPFHIEADGYVSDIVQYGDTMYMSGYFSDLILDKDSSIIAEASILKYYNDSIWASPSYIFAPTDMTVSGDSLFVDGGFFGTPDTLIGCPILSRDGAVTWRQPFNPNHPAGPNFNFGAYNKIEVNNGEVYVLNDEPEGPYNGVLKWEGVQWYGHGSGIYGTVSRAYDFEFYKGELYIAGSFSKRDDSRNSAEFVAVFRNGEWLSVGGGLDNSSYDLFKYNNVLYCVSLGDRYYGDAKIPQLAGWDGTQWCGTPINYGGKQVNNFGFIDDTLYAVIHYPPVTANGQAMSYINYFDGDYLHGPNAICSTPGLGEEENELRKAKIEVFPNPASDFLNIALPQEIETASYELLALDGKLLQNGVLTKGENTLRISQKLSGVFLLKVQTQSGSVVQKVVFEN